MAQDKPRKRRKAERPQEILAAAVELFAEKGFALTQMKEVATRAGVAKGTVYLYFKTKQELFEEIVRSNVSPVFNQMEQVLHQSDSSVAELLEKVLNIVYRELVESPTRRAVMRVLIAEGRQFPELVEFYHREVLQFAERLLGMVLAAARDKGEIRDCLAVREPRVVIGPAVMATIWRMTFDDAAPLNIQQFMQAHLDLVLNGLLKPTSCEAGENGSRIGGGV